MSYSFNWDCTLPISNIEDIVSINIVPQTKAYDEGDYLSLRGQVLIDGEYVTNHGTQETFTEYIPLDITLPNNGRGSEIKTDITNFDYEVQDGNNLFLTLNLSLDGYDWESPITLVEEDHEIEGQTQAPVMFTKEAAVVPSGHEVVAEAPVTQENVVVEPEVLEVVEEDETDDLDYIDFDEVVLDHKEDAVDPSLATERKEALTDKIKQFLNKQPVPVEESVVESVVEEPVVESVVEEVAPIVEEVVEKVVEKVKPKPVAPIPTVTKVQKVEEQPVTPVVEEEDEEILPFPLKTEPVVEEVPVETKKSDIFEMLYSLEETEPVVEEVMQAPVVEEVPMVEETLVSQPEVIVEDEVVEEPEVIAPISTYSGEDSIANQFLDGESILKIIFVQEEETTITNICTKYNVPEKAIYNLEQLNSPLHCGDRVMINYGKLR